MRFGGLVAVDKLNLQLGSQDLVGIIGPNGAGKTTVFNMITGHYRPAEGDIRLEGQSLCGKRPARITQQGIARTFQNIRLFKDLSVLDNIRLGAHHRIRYGLWSNILCNKKYRQEEERVREEALELLHIFGLKNKHAHLSKNLPYGEQRKLEIARALATKPKVLLLDEPAAGMNPKETKDLTQLIRWVRDQFKVAILLIEHDMRLVMDVCESIYVLDYGKLIAHGDPHRIQNDPKVIEAYLGIQEEGPSMSTAPLLQVKGMHVHYGNIHAIQGIDLSITKGEIVTVLGPNGAGKTTTLHTISGLLTPSQGSILFEGRPLTGLPANKIVARGISQSPEGRMVFPGLTVMENLEMGAYLRRDDKIERDKEDMFRLFPRLKERKRQPAGTLSGGEQQMLAIARACMANPRLLLLDEPSLGIAPILVKSIMEAICEINRRGTTILLVEQNAYAALKIAHRGYVLATGTVFMEGSAQELLDDKDIQKAYLGH